MFYEEYGVNNKEIIVMLHEAFLYDCFNRQLVLKDNYHLLIPHLIGFGNESSRVYDINQIVNELHEIIKKFNKPITLIGFSIGAQIGFKYLNDYKGFVKKAILVSPWLVKTNFDYHEVVTENINILNSLKNIEETKEALIEYGLEKDRIDLFLSTVINISNDSIINMVRQSIELKDYKDYMNINTPIIALCGINEDDDMKKSVLELSKNKYCKYEIWDNASHDIPTEHFVKFNKLINDFMKKDLDNLN